MRISPDHWTDAKTLLRKIKIKFFITVKIAWDCRQMCGQVRLKNVFSDLQIRFICFFGNDPMRE